ncbi:MAG TPA: addiction module protein [Longimicrobiaceae bacterium]|nr:addiction module protein [Longimicrobiaceae bacterium]
MSLPLERLEAEALELPAAERGRLARLLIASLEDEESEEDPTEVERAWDEEIRRRLAEYRAGLVKPIPATEVFAEARARLR